MRRIFGKLMAELAEQDEKVLLLVGDIGYQIFDEFKARFPGRFINIGLCEQSMISVASGMALEGLKPWVYTITPFLIERPFEQIKLDIAQQNVNVKLVGHADYPTQGPTHAEIDAKGLIGLLNNVKGFFPKNAEETINHFWEAYGHNGPTFMSLKEDKKYGKFEQISSRLDEQLPEIIKKIAGDNGIKEYYENPDFSDERLKKWHQYGLLTHTRKTRIAFSERLENILKSNGLYEEVNKKLQEKVEGVDKKTLLEISIVLHDLGKVICLHDKSENRKHEFISAVLLDAGFLKNKLRGMGLENRHISYIRRCVETHGVIGKEIRGELKAKEQLKLEYLDCDEVKKKCMELAKKYEDVSIEAGLFFICDSLGKFDISNVENFKNKELDEELKYGIMQQPINLKLGQIYLKEAIKPC